jgi:Common central domain of tyrosinase/Polyphenol oxidase middle domain
VDFENSGGAFTPVYQQGDPGNGIGGYDLKSSADRAFAFDYEHSGKLDYISLYRPGTGTMWILKNSGGAFTPVYQQGDPGNGIGGYDLKSSADRAFAFDYEHSGKLDYISLYRPGTGTIWILQNNYVRRNIRSLAANGPEIAALRKGIQVMQGRSLSDPTSWIYQANMHGTVDSPLLPAWHTCQHGTFFFLSWHRMYLYYFERILRAASGDPNLTLPYWNYSDTADSNARALPLPFRQPQDATNPLFVTNRDPAINAGGLLPASDVDLSALTNFTNFSSVTGSALSFGGQTVTAPNHSGFPHSAFERTPHDNVHSDIGGWMGSFNTAARDPIFWLHHANIDRLWEQWLASGGGRSNPTTDTVWMTTQFEFFDEYGHSVKLSGQQILNTASQLNYVYNQNPWHNIAQVTPNPTATLVSPAAPVPVSRRSVRQLGTSEVPAVELQREPATVLVKLVKEEEFTLKAPERAIVLDIEGVEFDQMPSGHYEIYLNLPEGERPHFPSKYYVGSLPFFGLKPRQERHEGEEPPRFSYDITKIIDRLKSDKKWNTQEARVTFVKQDVIAPRGMRIERKVIPVRIRHVTITTE